LPAPIRPGVDFPPGSNVDVSKPLRFPWEGGDAGSRVILKVSGWLDGVLMDTQVSVAETAQRGELLFELSAPVPPYRWELDWGEEVRIHVSQRTKDDGAVQPFSANGLTQGGWQVWEYEWNWPGLVPFVP